IQKKKEVSRGTRYRTAPYILKLSIHEKVRSAICPKSVFSPIHLVEKLGKAFIDVPKFVLRHGTKSQNSTHPDSSSPTRGISSFISSLDARCNVGRSFVVPLASHRGLKLESEDCVLDFKLEFTRKKA
ncbi:hypothetical protein AVEN_57603-1, partial [Araneus ventricosus]